MSIQQSINQMLALTATGVGLYAHSPEGQRKAEIKQLEKAYKKTDENITSWSEPITSDEVDIAEKNAALQRKRSERLYELDPTEKRAQQLREDLKGDPAWHTEGMKTASKEVQALQSLTKKVGVIESRMTEFEKRKAILKKSRKKGGR